jgi:hypothetical protein
MTKKLELPKIPELESEHSRFLTPNTAELSEKRSKKISLKISICSLLAVGLILFFFMLDFNTLNSENMVSKNIGRETKIPSASSNAIAIDSNDQVIRSPASFSPAPIEKNFDQNSATINYIQYDQQETVDHPFYDHPDFEVTPLDESDENSQNISFGEISEPQSLLIEE